MLCFFFPIVFLLLTSTSTAAGQQIRLTGSGSTQCSGRVEIYHNNAWGTVCDDNWDINDAKVVCRQLGCGPSLRAPQSAHFGEGTGQIWLDDVSCSGSEKSLTECQHRGFGTHDCSHGEDAGVVCSDVRLAGSGSTQCSGRVEIYHNYVWGTVCDDDWDLNDAKVVCRQLGCGTSLSAPREASFGQGTGQIWLDDVSCSGSEKSLTKCRHNGFGTHNCGHGEDASVVCSADLQKPSISMNPAGEVNWGQSISITCSISTQLLGGTFTLKKTSGSFRKTQTSSTNSATFNSHNVNFDNEGSYQCQYEKSISSQLFSSPLSDSVRLSVTVILPKPSISMNPAGKVSWGQSISITCSISTQHLGGTFTLKKTSGSFRDTQSSSTNSATFNIRNVNFDNEGSYQCQYEKSISSRSFSSPLSDSVRLSVTVTFPKPRISMNPAGEVSWGQYIRITCSISTQLLGGTFTLKKDSGSFRMTQSSSTNSSNFNFPNVNFDNEGSYKCLYEKRSPRRNFNSPLSDSVRFSVNVPLQQPNISLTSPNSGLVWGPEGAEVTRGYSFVLTCSINSNYHEGRFLLIFSGSNITNTKPAVNLSASFNYPVAEYEHEGNYSCVYEVTLSRLNFSSPETAPITVTIKLPLLLLVSSVAAGSLLLFLLVLLLVCLVCRRRQQVKHPIAIAMSPVVVSALNVYQGVEEEEEGEDYQNIEAMCTGKTLKDDKDEEDGEDYENTEAMYTEKKLKYDKDEEDGEDYENTEAMYTEKKLKDDKDEEDGEDYENTEAMYTKKKLREQAGVAEEEDCDDKKLESDKDHDYEDMDNEADYIKMEEVTVEDNREEEEEEEEFSDDEDDYENVG